MSIHAMKSGFQEPRTTNFGQALWPGALAHKQNLAEVLITGLQAEGDRNALVCVQWPRAHYFYSVNSAEADTLLISETMRQICVALAHSQFGVEFSKKFVLSNLQVDNLGEIPNFSTLTPTDIHAHVRVNKLERNKSSVVRQHITVEFAVGPKIFALGSLAARILDADVYRRLRKGASAISSNSIDFHHGAHTPYVRHVTRGDAIKQTEHKNRWILTPDTNHPILFDHPLDHVPGMFLVECLRQAASYRMGHSYIGPRNVKIEFLRMIELADECTLELSSCHIELGRSTFQFTQFGQIAARGTLWI